MVLKEITAQSSVEAEYISVSLATQQTLWLKRILEDFGEKQENVTIHYGNKSTIAIPKIPVYHGRIKHISIKHHFIREAIQDEEAQLSFCKTNHQVVYIYKQALYRRKNLEIKRSTWSSRTTHYGKKMFSSVLSLNACIRYMYLECSRKHVG